MDYREIVAEVSDRFSSFFDLGEELVGFSQKCAKARTVSSDNSGAVYHSAACLHVRLVRTFVATQRSLQAGLVDAAEVLNRSMFEIYLNQRFICQPEIAYEDITVDRNTRANLLTALFLMRDEQLLKTVNHKSGGNVQVDEHLNSIKKHLTVIEQQVPNKLWSGLRNKKGYPSSSSLGLSIAKYSEVLDKRAYYDLIYGVQCRATHGSALEMAGTYSSTQNGPSTGVKWFGDQEEILRSLHCSFALLLDGMVEYLNLMSNEREEESEYFELLARFQKLLRSEYPIVCGYEFESSNEQT